MTTLEAEVRDLRRMLTLMGTGMAHILAWAREVERTGSVPLGTLDRAQKLVEVHSLQDELSLCNEALVKLTEENADLLQLHLRKRIQTLRSDLLRLTEELEKADGA